MPDGKTQKNPATNKIVADQSTEEAVKNNPKELLKLLNAGLDPNSHIEHSTLLNISILAENFESFKLLVENGADLNLSDGMGKTPIIFMCSTPDVRFLDLALKHGVKLEVDKSEPNSKELVSIAAMYGNVDILKELVANGLDLNVKEEGNNSPLHLAVDVLDDEYIMKCLYLGEKFRFNDKEYQERLKNFHEFDANQSENVKWLIKSGVNVNLQNDVGNTPLHLAIKNNTHKVIKSLIDLKADVNIKNNEQETPLHIAIQNSPPSIVEMILNAGADKEATDQNGETAIHLAARCKFPKILQTLVEDGANVKTQNTNGQTALHIAASNIYTENIYILTDKGGDIEAKDNQNQAVTHMAAMSKNPEMVEIFAEFIADFEVATINGDYPLHLAAKAGHPQNIQFFKDMGISINLRNEYFSTPLHEASMNKNLENVKLLISLGADKNATDEFDYTPLELIAEMGNEELINELK